MKSFTILLPVLAALATAGKVDECAGSCISEAIASTGCASSDSLCICGSNTFIESVEQCGPCSEDGSNAAVALAQDYCETVSHSSLKRSYEWDGHSYGWWQKEWRKVRAGWKENGKGGEPAPKDPSPAPPSGYKPSPPKGPAPAPYDPPPPPPSYPGTSKSEHPIEDWFTAHPNYLINHPGWLAKHPNWATKHHDYLVSHLPKDSPYWGGKPPHQPPHGYPVPPKDPHHPYPTTKPTSTRTETCTTHKPSPTVW